jgi:digeranylgeranylglycerophospholipid reductase
MMIKDSYDVIVVGGGPAGSSAGEACAKLGLDVLVLERNNELGTPKRCGEGMSDNSIKRLGLDIPKRCIAQEVHGAYAYAPNGRTIKIKYANTNGYILERKVFDKWLASRAASAGAKVIAKVEVVNLIKDKNQVTGVVARTMDGDIPIKANVIVAADGVESVVMRMAGLKTNKKPTLVDSGFQYEMAGIDIPEPDMIDFFFGNKIAPRGYAWIFPKGNDIANVGIGINGSLRNVTARAFLDKFISERPALKKGSILEVNAGSVPVGGFMKNMVSDGIVGVGDAVNQVNPIHGGGIPESIIAGRLAADVIKKAHNKKDFTKKILSEYNEIWWKERGSSLEKIEKVREMFEKMSDEEMCDAVETLQGVDLYDLAHGKNIFKLTKIVARYKMKGLSRKLGLKK